MHDCLRWRLVVDMRLNLEFLLLLLMLLVLIGRLGLMLQLLRLGRVAAIRKLVCLMRKSRAEKGEIEFRIETENPETW